MQSPGHVDKTPLQAVFDQGLRGLYTAIERCAANPARDGEGLSTDIHSGGHPLNWYVSKCLDWQAVALSVAYVFAEHHGALLMPNAWVLFQSRFAKAFQDHPVTWKQAYAWTLTEKAQELLALEERQRHAQEGKEV